VESVMVTVCAEVKEPPAGEIEGVAVTVGGGVDEPPPPPQPASMAVADKASNILVRDRIDLKTQSFIELSPRSSGGSRGIRRQDIAPNRPLFGKTFAGHGILA
jgi:hypothetical protein